MINGKVLDFKERDIDAFAGSWLAIQLCSTWALIKLLHLIAVL